MKVIFLAFITFGFLLSLEVYEVNSSSKSDQLNVIKFPPCKACKILVESFKKGMTKTAKGKFEGGDTAWEEKKLGSYATSEVRLVEIQENMCKEIDEGKDQCFSLAEQHDTLLEEWWFKKQNENSDLYNWLCVTTLQYCCLDFHYGPECKPCSGFPDNVCSRNGKCKGAGTRKGNGICVCDPGYHGDTCASCAVGYYQSYKDENKMLCSKCHQSCFGGCTQSGNKGCFECAKGWFKDEERGCLDINECTAEKPVCNKSQFCVNTDGSFKCLDCDRSCEGCTGDGPDMCNQCAPGYFLKDNVCVDTSQQDRTSYVTFTRYLTYLGLCFATCIILQRNVTVAAIVGLAVGIYISVSEYMLATGATLNYTDPVIDTDSLLKLIR